MIISHRHEFIFLKTSKTGSTSVEIALSRFCGDDDVITPISPEDELIRKELGYRGPQNWKLSEDSEETVSNPGKGSYWNHIEAARLKAFLPADVWTRYYKFCVVRNPWDRLVSMYYWQNRNSKFESIDAFLEKKGIPEKLRRRGIDIYTIDGEVVVDKLCRYDSLERDLEEVRKTIGISEPLVLPLAKSGYRPSDTPYHQVLKPEYVEAVTKSCSDELEIIDALQSNQEP